MKTITVEYMGEAYCDGYRDALESVAQALSNRDTSEDPYAEGVLINILTEIMNLRKTHFKQQEREI